MERGEEGRTTSPLRTQGLVSSNQIRVAQYTKVFFTRLPLSFSLLLFDYICYKKEKTRRVTMREREKNFVSLSIFLILSMAFAPSFFASAAAAAQLVPFILRVEVQVWKLAFTTAAVIVPFSSPLFSSPF